MGKSIKLSPKHGVNPTRSIREWWGKEKNEIVLLGRIGGKEYIEAPKNMVLDFEPCDECASKMSMGITCMECTEKPNPSCNVAFADRIYPTGRYVVIKQEAAERIFSETVDFEKHQKVFVDSVAYQSLFGDYVVEIPSIDTNSEKEKG